MNNNNNNNRKRSIDEVDKELKFVQTHISMIQKEVREIKDEKKKRNTILASASESESEEDKDKSSQYYLDFKKIQKASEDRHLSWNHPSNPFYRNRVYSFVRDEEEKKGDEKKAEEKKGEEKKGEEKKGEEKKKQVRRQKIVKENPPFDPFLDDYPNIPPVVITLLGLHKNSEGGGGGGGGGGEEESEEMEKKKRKKEEDFYDYFTQASELTPIDKEIQTLKDLIDLGKTYDPQDPKRYVIQMKALHKCVPVLEELDHMIGMKNVKSMIMDLLFFRLQKIEDQEILPPPTVLPEVKKPRIVLPFGNPPKGGSCGSGDDEEASLNVCTMETLNQEKSALRDMYHMVITGSPGCGKTEVAKILAKLYYCLGIAKKDKFTLARRSDLIGKFLGHTAKMTQDVFNKAKGGILFIDEAYALGNPEGRDSFSKECIDTINQNLTENKDTVVFIAGYKEQLEESFFAYNPGLHRRFKFRLEVDKYNAEELRLIYIKKIQDSKWGFFENNVDKSIPLALFEKHREVFKFNGGDMENLWHLTKIVHARRIFGKSQELVKKIHEEDVKRAISLYMENDEVKKRNDDIKKYIRDTIYI